MTTSCKDCVHSQGTDCLREEEVFSQAYETKYTDRDFCGPGRRYFQRKIVSATNGDKP